MSDERALGPREPEDGPDHPEPEDVKTGTSMKLKDAMKEMKAANDNVEVAGLTIADSQKAAGNLEAALAHLGKHFKIDKDSIYFQKFSGNYVGESRESGTYIDPIMLMHPTARLVRVLSHELGHNNDQIQNEGLVDAYAKTVGMLGDDSEVTEVYEKALENFYGFIERVRGNREVNECVKEVYELYYQGEFEKIYELYEESCINTLPKGQEEAFAFFNIVFPELEVKGDGQYHPLDEEVGPVIKPEFRNAA